MVNLAIWYALAIKSFVRVVYVRLRDAKIKLVWKEHFIEKSFRRNARISVIAKSDKEGLTKNESDAIHIYSWDLEVLSSEMAELNQGCSCA